MAKNNYFKSPMNYTGGKHKLLPQILPLFPENVNTFVDLFAGGANVAINVNAKRIIANDFDSKVIGIYKRFQELSIEEILSHIENRIKEFQLSKTNNEGFLALRDLYNSTKNEPLDLFVLICYSFNHQIRFNSKGEYNMPFGKDRSEFNDTIKKNLINFRERIEGMTFTSMDFRELKPEKLNPGDFVYCDPPYLITCATYNEKDGWNEQCERDLLSLLDKLDERGIYFALSNVLSNKGKENTILKEWCEKYHTVHLSNTYGNCSYHAKDKSTDSTDEVLIVNTVLGDDVRKRIFECQLNIDKAMLNIPNFEQTSETGLSTEELIKLCHEICSKTIGYDLASVKKEEIGTFIQNFVEKATNGKWTTNGVDGLYEWLIGHKKDDSNDISN